MLYKSIYGLHGNEKKLVMACDVDTRNNAITPDKQQGELYFVR